MHNVPSTTLAFAQKVFPFLDRFGFGTFGTGQLLGRSIYFLVRQLEAELRGGSEEDRPQGVRQVADTIAARVHTQLEEQFRREGKSLTRLNSACCMLMESPRGAYCRRGWREFLSQAGRSR